MTPEIATSSLGRRTGQQADRRLSGPGGPERPGPAAQSRLQHSRLRAGVSARKVLLDDGRQPDRLGLANVKEMIKERIVRSDQSELIKARLQRFRSMKMIDMVTVTFDEKDQGGKYWAKFATSGMDKVHIDERIVYEYERTLDGWRVGQSRARVRRVDRSRRGDAALRA